MDSGPGRTWLRRCDRPSTNERVVGSTLSSPGATCQSFLRQDAELQITPGGVCEWVNMAYMLQVTRCIDIDHMN